MSEPNRLTPAMLRAAIKCAQEAEMPAKDGDFIVYLHHKAWKKLRKMANVRQPKKRRMNYEARRRMGIRWFRTQYLDMYYSGDVPLQVKRQARQWYQFRKRRSQKDYRRGKGGGGSFRLWAVDLAEVFGQNRKHHPHDEQWRLAVREFLLKGSPSGN